MLSYIKAKELLCVLEEYQSGEIVRYLAITSIFEDEVVVSVCVCVCVCACLLIVFLFVIP